MRYCPPRGGTLLEFPPFLVAGSLLDKQHLRLSRYQESWEFLHTKCKLLALSTDEPLAHTSAEDKDDEEDQDGLTPAVLWAKFEDEVTLNDWLVPAEAALKCVGHC